MKEEIIRHIQEMDDTRLQVVLGFVKRLIGGK